MVTFVNGGKIFTNLNYQGNLPCTYIHYGHTIGCHDLSVDLEELEGFPFSLKKKINKMLGA